MNDTHSKSVPPEFGPYRPTSEEALAEIEALGILEGAPVTGIPRVQGRGIVPRTAVHAPEVINEATDYSRPSSFSRGLRVELPGATMILMSGTASVNVDGTCEHEGNFEAQCWRTYRNLTELLAAEGASWHDVVRTTCYLRDIERDYELFNHIRTAFFLAMGLDPMPASTGIQARLCWSNLLIEMELMAIIPKEKGS
jgi:enamine deaminase RidA (YjgF/YER057c/UK114 family)